MSLPGDHRRSIDPRLVLDLEKLNREQLDAVLTTEGPLLVLAGAGSGKTRVITYRLAHLLRLGVDPKQILAVTFTNKAAHEMRGRAKKLAGKTLRGAAMSTFHALGVRILRRFPDRVGLRPGFTISDAADQLGTLRRILRQIKIDDRRFDAKKLLSIISRAKNAGIDSDAFRRSGGALRDEAPFSEDEDYQVAAIEAYARYEAELRAQNLVDFDDLLLMTVHLLKQDATVLAALQARWRYLMVDEYQDTNGAQFELMRLLAGARKNLCVVGDDDQSIYGWRGADVTNILRFEEHFAGAKVVKLETNYRSTGNILDVANAIIAQNDDRYDKRLRAAAGRGARVRLVAMEDEDEEADQVARAIFAMTSADEAKPHEVAVLFRSNVQSRPLELALRREHLPYRVVGGMDLFDRKEIKDALAFLRVLNNPDDEQSLRRIINVPPRGIGTTAVARVEAYARDHELGLFAAFTQADRIDGLSPRAQDNTAAFVDLIRTHQKLVGKRKVSTVARKLIEASGFEAFLFESSDNGTTASRRVDNVRAIVKQIERYESRVRAAHRSARLEAAAQGVEFDRLPDDFLPDSDDLELIEGATLEGFLRDLALGNFDHGNPRDDKGNQVVLSTIHAAKGLEWPYVFVVGAEEELLPHKRTMEAGGEVAEERRLVYVAVTRARKVLTISYARNRTKWGRIVPRQRSRFMDDLPKDCLECREDDLSRERTPEEREAIEKAWRAKIRAQLGIV